MVAATALTYDPNDPNTWPEVVLADSWWQQIAGDINTNWPARCANVAVFADELLLGQVV